MRVLAALGMACLISLAITYFALALFGVEEPRADAPLSTCSVIRERKVCNIEADLGENGVETPTWTGRFAACAPEIPFAAVALDDDGYTQRVIVWCSPSR